MKTAKFQTKIFVYNNYVDDSLYGISYHRKLKIEFLQCDTTYVRIHLSITLHYFHDYVFVGRVDYLQNLQTFIPQKFPL